LKAQAQAAARRRRERRVAAPEGILHDDHVSWEEVRTVLDAELAGLPEKWRSPLILCYLESRTQEEAAAQLGWRKNTLGRRLQEAREALGRRLARRGLAVSAAFYGLLLSDSTASAVVAPELIASTVEAGCGVALGGTAVPLVSAKVIALTEGAVKTVFVRSVILLAFGGIALGLGAAGAVRGVPARPQLAQQQTDPPQAAASGTKPANPAGEQSSSQKRALVDADSVQPKSLPLTGHKSLVRAIAFSRDGKKVATTGVVDNTLRVWDSATGRQTAQMDLPGDGTGIAFSPDGKELAVGSGGSEGGLTYVDTETGKAIWRIGGVRGCMGSVSVSPDGTRVAAGFAVGTAYVIDALSGKFVTEFKAPAESGLVVATAFSPDTKLLALGTSKGFVFLIDGETGRIVRQFGQGRGSVTTLAYLAGGRKLAVAENGEYQDVRILDIATGREDKAFRGKKGIWAFAISPDGRSAAVARVGGEIEVWDVAAGMEERHFATLGPVQGVAFDPEGKRVATAGENGTAIIWDLTGDEEPLAAGLKLTPRDLASARADLGSEEDGKAYAALRKLRADPERSVPFLRERLQQRAERPDAQKLKQWIADLDADNFPTREKASQELGKLGKAAEKTMRDAFAAGASLEAKRRLERLLTQIDHPLSAGQQRDVRAVRVLEQTGTPEALKLLEALQKESPGWWVAEEATAALERLKCRKRK
jgi:DNA-binding beta-propeller fold protein YncE